MTESSIGMPFITNLRYATSENTIHQIYHISKYYSETGKDILKAKTIVEWGGGYGCLARAVKKYNSEVTYIIMDLPELCILQKIYLSSIFGENVVDIIYDLEMVAVGKINIISSDIVMKAKKKFQTNTFISNWAITESGKDYQDYITSQHYFSADNILIACAQDSNNYLTLSDYFPKIVPIKVLDGTSVYLMK